MGNGYGTVSKANIKRDIAGLKIDTELVTTWATEHVAHLSRQPPPGGLKIGDFDKAIADVVAVDRKYGVLLTAVDYAIDGAVEVGFCSPIQCTGTRCALLGIGTFGMVQWSFSVPASRNRRRPTLGYPGAPSGMSQWWRADLG